MNKVVMRRALLASCPGSSLDKCCRGLYQGVSHMAELTRGFTGSGTTHVLYQGTTLVGP